MARSAARSPLTSAVPSRPRGEARRDQEAHSTDWVHQQIETVAKELFESDTDWITFFREIFGPEGLIRTSLPTAPELAAFSETEIYSRIQQMMSALRTRSDDDRRREPIRVITVRIPDSLHRLLKQEAKDFGTSMNQLCVSKLLQDISAEYVPTDASESP